MQLRSFSVTWKNMWYLLFGIYRGFGISGLVWTALYLDDCLNSYAKHHYSLLFSLAECRQCIGNEALAISSNQQKALNYVRKQNLSPNPRFLPTIVCFRSQVPKVGEALAGLCQANTAGVFTCFRFGFVCFACLFVFLSVCLFFFCCCFCSPDKKLQKSDCAPRFVWDGKCNVCNMNVWRSSRLAFVIIMATM